MNKGMFGMLTQPHMAEFWRYLSVEVREVHSHEPMARAAKEQPDTEVGMQQHPGGKRQTRRAWAAEGTAATDGPGRQGRRPYWQGEQGMPVLHDEGLLQGRREAQLPPQAVAGVGWQVFQLRFHGTLYERVHDTAQGADHEDRICQPSLSGSAAGTTEQPGEG